ncbi:MAG: nicotinate-nucleotide diphosphorylase (carboxylating), partial [Colwellia sp.]|nr:nicotinate-nucleotide diphosphorylase (carboxylating) [Colwellia sp.]
MLTSESIKLKNDVTATVAWALKEDLGVFGDDMLSAEQDITAM